MPPAPGWSAPPGPQGRPSSSHPPLASFLQWIRHLIGYLNLRRRTCSRTDKGKVGDDLLGVLSLSGTRLASDCIDNWPSVHIKFILTSNLKKNVEEIFVMPKTKIWGCNHRLTEDGLILDFKAHGVIRAFSDGEDVWWNLTYIRYSMCYTIVSG